jgi:hypothetical protein
VRPNAASRPGSATSPYLEWTSSRHHTHLDETSSAKSVLACSACLRIAKYQALFAAHPIIE